VCLERPRDVVLMPCMHFVTCAQCQSRCGDGATRGSGGGGAAGGAGGSAAPSVGRCVVCRQAVMGQIVVHLASGGGPSAGGGGLGLGGEAAAGVGGDGGGGGDGAPAAKRLRG
jgi:hypothetical protein